MVYEIFVNDSLSSRSLLKNSNKALNQGKKKFQKNNTVFSKYNTNYVISVFDKRIRISITDSEKTRNDVNDIEKYLSTVLNGRTIFIPKGNDFKKTFNALKNINIVEV